MAVKLDQHFLKDNRTLKKIVRIADLRDNDIVFEIGPGKGVLTEELLKCDVSKVICVEMDEQLYLDIYKKYEDDVRVDPILGNGLEIMTKFRFTKLVSNIPYSITEPLIKGMIDSKVEFAVFLFGMDFYKNITERNSRWKYFVNAFYEVEKIYDVPGEYFEPPTKVRSAVVRFAWKDEVRGADKFWREFYLKGDRSLKNCLIFSFVDSYGISKNDARDILIKIGLPEKDLDNNAMVVSKSYYPSENADLI